MYELIKDRYVEALKSSIVHLPILLIAILLTFALIYIENEEVYRLSLLLSKIFYAFYISNIIYYFIAPKLKINKKLALNKGKITDNDIELYIKITFLRILLFIGTAIALTI